MFPSDVKNPDAISFAWWAKNLSPVVNWFPKCKSRPRDVNSSSKSNLASSANNLCEITLTSSEDWISSGNGIWTGIDQSDSTALSGHPASDNDLIWNSRVSPFLIERSNWFGLTSSADDKS